jgi:predicted dehydrogenase
MQKICVIHETGGERLGGHFIENAFWGLPGVEISAYADSNKNRDANNSVTGAGKRYYDYREMIYTENPDILVVASRDPEEHYQQINFAIDHDCHVLTEKPFVADLIEGDCLIKKAKAKNKHIAVAYLARYAPVFKEMKRIIESGEIGQILNCYLRGKEDDRGGGEDMIVLGSHLLDLAVYFFGHPEDVYADIRTKGKRIVAGETIPTDEPIGLTAGDEVMAIYHFSNGIRTVFESRRNLVARDVCTRMGIVVSGTKGSLAVRFDDKRMLRISRDFPMPCEDASFYTEIAVPSFSEIPDVKIMDYSKCVQKPDCYYHRYYADNNRRAAWDLLQAIETGKKPLSSAEDAIWSVEMIIGAYRSSIEKRVISFPLAERQHPLCKQDSKVV